VAGPRRPVALGAGIVGSGRPAAFAGGTLSGVRRSPFVAGPTLSIVLAAACSSTAVPRELGDCVPDGAPCDPPPPATSSSSDPDAAIAPSCGVAAGASQCDLCAGAHCCPTLSACDSSVPCQNLLSCENACSGYAPCVAGCEQQYPTAVTLVDDLSSCLTLECAVCSQLGTGDPCQAQATGCNAGLTCSGLWCTRTCQYSSDCAGLGPGGGNALGFANVCRRTPSFDDACFPGCTTDGDCASFPGTYCVITTSIEGESVSVCATSADAGTD
jgi:hypothetical protein